MILVAAKGILVTVAVYFLALGGVALLRPNTARQFLLGFADTPFKHYAELAVRLIVGGSLLLGAPSYTHSKSMAAFGWILVTSTAVMAVIPWKFHHRFAQSAVPKALRYLPLIGVASLVLGILLLLSIVTGTDAQQVRVGQPRAHHGLALSFHALAGHRNVQFIALCNQCDVDGSRKSAPAPRFNRWRVRT